jgi:anti-sigma factor RsiW
MTCRHVLPLLDAFVDGELGPERVLEVEDHLEHCEICAERVRVADALRASTRRAVRAATVPSDAFQARVQAALRAERARVAPEATAVPAPPPPARLGWNTAVPLAAAAAATLLVLSATERTRAPRTPDAPVHAAVAPAPEPLSIVATVENLLDDLVSAHATPPPPQVTEPTLVEGLEPEVGVPVHLPHLGPYGARWEGGSVIPVRNKHRAAVFRYRLSNHPVTVYVYDARNVPLRVVLEPRVVRNMPVHVGAHRGYSIAAREQRGVGYAVATDLGGEESAELVAAIH